MDAAAVGAGRLGFTHAAPRRGRRGDHAVQLPGDPRHPQDRPGARRGQRRDPQARAGATPLTALFLVERLVGRGPAAAGALQCLTGPGRAIGAALCGDRRVRKISFTGSGEAGAAIARAAGAKRLTCELGSNAALVVLDDADLDRAAAAIAFSGYTNAGQNCVSTQRVARRRGGPRRARRAPVAARRRAAPRRSRRDPATTLSPRDRRARGAARALARWIARRGRRGRARRRARPRDRGGRGAARPARRRPRCGATSCSARPSRSGRSHGARRRSRSPTTPASGWP